MRALWTGSISFGLINIPVRLYSGSESRGGIELNMVRKSDMSPIGYKKVAKKDNKGITFGEVVKAYEYQPGEYVVITDEDFEKANAEKTKTIDIAEFTDEREIDVRYFEKPYYLEPMKGAEKPYALLREALAKSGKIAVARFVLRNREHLAAVKPVGQVLVLNQMRFPSDLRTPSGLNLPGDKDVKEPELEMAEKLIDQLTKPFIAEDFYDTYTAELEKVIEAKIKGKKPKRAGKAPAAAANSDLMAALKASLGGMGASSKAKESSAKSKKK
ncbi:MAG TPA: Ku protein [Candidatus Polarisedimenticolaceae bacterium]|nr:Ku protein [Candidatus Polarisedimenticolaceae bacterium]